MKQITDYLKANERFIDELVEYGAEVSAWVCTKT